MVLEPARVTCDGPWVVHSWPDVDLPVGRLVALQVVFPAERGARYLANGWQSWSAPTIRTLGHPSALPPHRGLSRRHLLRLAGAGDASYDVLATADAVVGFTKGGGLLVADAEAGLVYAVRRHVGSPHPPVHVATGDGAALVDDLLDRCGGRVPSTQPVGWSTWKGLGPRMDFPRLTVALTDVHRLTVEGLCDAVLLDDGWQRRIGDWFPDADRFPSRVAALAEAVLAAGAAPGLWTAPLLLSPHSELAAQRPEWVARHPDGRPVVGARVPEWGGDTWVLDATRADVREHLTTTAAEHAAAGFTTFKLDFLYAAVDAADAEVARLRAAGADDGTGKGRLVAGDEVLVAVLDAIRLGAGEDVTLLGCGAPLWPSIGRVDWMRVGPDVTRYYRPVREPDSDPAMVSSLLNGWRASALRGPMHRRLWGNDPDTVPLSATSTGLVGEKRLGFARWVAASGQLLTLSDDFGDLSPADLAEWRRLVRRSRRVPPTPPDRALAAVL